MLIYDWNPLIDVAPLAARPVKSKFAPIIVIAIALNQLTDATTGILNAKGIPSSEITDLWVGRCVASTADEASALRESVRAELVEDELSRIDYGVFVPGCRSIVCGGSNMPNSSASVKFWG